MVKSEIYEDSSNKWFNSKRFSDLPISPAFLSNSEFEDKI